MDEYLFTLLSKRVPIGGVTRLINHEDYVYLSQRKSGKIRPKRGGYFMRKKLDKVDRPTIGYIDGKEIALFVSKNEWSVYI